MREAIARYVRDGMSVAIEGFTAFICFAAGHEIIRQRRRDLSLAGKTAVHDCDLLVASGCVTRIEVAYAFGHELRGLSPASRRAVESGACQVVGEISLALREQRETSTNIAQSVERIARMSEQSHAATRDSLQRAQALDGLAEGLARAVGRFRVAG